MAVVTRTRSILESLVREGSMKWLLGGRSMFDEDFEEMGKPPSARKNWLPLLSPIANLVIRRCLSVLGIFMIELVSNFESEALDYIKHPARYARNILEFCCFQTLVLSTKVPGHLGDKKFRRLTFDMMVAWEAPSSTDFIPNEDNTAGLDAFSRIAPAIPTVSDVITCDNLFNALTAATGGRLYFSVYDKYLRGLERAIRRFKTETESSLLSVLRSRCGEKILEVDGTVTTQPVLEHVGVSTWPGRLTLTDHSLYFEEHRVVSFDKAKLYNLSEDLKQVVKPELTGPWGTRIFDRAVMYKSISLSEPVVIEFPEIKGHSRRDYWLAIIREILYAHKFIRKYQIKGVARDEALSKAVFGILRLQAIQEIAISKPICSEGLLIFNLCDQLPGGDFILETLGRMASSQDLDQPDVGSVMYSISSMAVMSNLGLMFGVSSKHANEAGLVVGEITVGEMTSLERAVRDSRNSYKEVELAQATVDGVKVEGIDTNLAVMKELLFPLMELVKYINFLASWDDPMKSLGFCSLSAYIIYRGWIGQVLAFLVFFIAVFMLLTRWCNQGMPVDRIKVTAPPAMNAMEQLLVLQNTLSQVEELVQEGTVSLLKLRALLLSVFPQASEKLALALLLASLVLAFIPSKYIFLLTFLYTFTGNSPLMKTSTSRWIRRLREWWFSIPAAPAVLEKPSDHRKRK